MRRVFNLFIRHVSYVSERIPLYKQLNHFFFYLQIRNNHLNFRSFLLFLCLVLMIKHLHMLRNVFILFMIRDEGILLRKISEIWSIAVLLFQTMKLCFWYIFFRFRCVLEQKLFEIVFDFLAMEMCCRVTWKRKGNTWHWNKQVFNFM